MTTTGTYRVTTVYIYISRRYTCMMVMSYYPGRLLPCMHACIHDAYNNIISCVHRACSRFLGFINYPVVRACNYLLETNEKKFTNTNTTCLKSSKYTSSYIYIHHAWIYLGRGDGDIACRASRPHAWGLW